MVFFSPNTPGLRNLQARGELTKLLSALIATRNNLPESSRRPLLLKLSPDLTCDEKQDIAEVLQNPLCRVDGLIISNTTIQRLLLKDKNKNEIGGLSGEPLRDMSTKAIRDMYKLTNGMTIIGKNLFLKVIIMSI